MIRGAMETNDSFDDLWELAEFSSREAHILRSFLEYLRTWPDPMEKKLERIQNWKKEVGMKLGSPCLLDQSDGAFQTIRDAPPQLRRETIQQSLAAGGWPRSPSEV
jgi:hypothetical protein